MEKRAFERISASLEFHCFNIDYYGTVKNLSEKGMLIKSQKINFPLELQFYMSITLREEIVNVPVEVRRITKSNGYYDSIGVEILEQPQKYLKLINRLRVA